MKVHTEWKLGMPLLHLHTYDLKQWKTHFEAIGFEDCVVPIEIPDREAQDIQSAVYALKTGDVDAFGTPGHH